MKDSINAPHPPTPPVPQQAPQQYFQQPLLVVLQNPITHQGVMNTQQEIHPVPPQMGQYQKPGNPTDRNILLTSKEEFFLQKHSHQYNAPLESTPTTLEASPATVGQPLMSPCPNPDPPIHIPHIPLK
jgi:hypothetical protein